MVQSSGNTAERFLQHSNNAEGTTARNFELINDNTKKRMVDENTIKGAVIQNGGNLDNVITGILAKYKDSIAAYIAAHGEIVDNDPVRMATQAVILRGKDVANLANALDTTDEDALQEIEKGEMAAQDINSPDNETVLSTEAQAALKIAMDYIADCHEQIGGDGTMSSAIKDMGNYAISKGNAASNNADGVDPLAGIIDTSGYYPDTSNTALPGLATIPVDNGTIGSATMPSITANPAPNANTSGIVNSATDTSGVLGTLASIFSGIQSAATGITSAANSVATAGGAVKNAIGNVGANALSTYISQNKTTIIFVVLMIAVIIFVIIYASKHHSK